MKHLASEHAIYGLIMVAGLVVIVADKAEASWEILVKVAVTVVVFWVAHVFAGTVAHLSDEIGPEIPAVGHLESAFRYSVAHSWEMLFAAAIALIPLAFGVVNLLDDDVAIWATMWVTVFALGVVGFAKVAMWSDALTHRLLGGASIAGLGVVLIGLKALVH